MYTKDTSEMSRLLRIANPHNATIYDVVGRMEVLLDIFTKDRRYHSLLPFLKTYYLVTKAAAEKYSQKKHFF